MPKRIVLDGQDAYVRATHRGEVQFRYLDENTWFWLDGFERSAKDILTRLSPDALRTIADAKESPDV